MLPSGIKMVPSLHSPFNLCPIAHLAMNTKEPLSFAPWEGLSKRLSPSLLSAGRIMALPFSHSQPSPETAINDFTPLSSFQTLVNYTAAVASSLISHPKNFAAPLINYTRHPPSVSPPTSRKCATSFRPHVTARIRRMRESEPPPQSSG